MLDAEEANLRDIYAGLAINCFSLDNDDVRKLQSHNSYAQHELVAKFCYDLADAMITERRKRMESK